MKYCTEGKRQDSKTKGKRMREEKDRKEEKRRKREGNETGERTTKTEKENGREEREKEGGKEREGRRERTEEMHHYVGSRRELPKLLHNRLLAYFIRSLSFSTVVTSLKCSQ